MWQTRRSAVLVLAVLMLLLPALAACSTPAATPAPTSQPAAPTSKPAEPTHVPVPREGPAVGGTLVWNLGQEPETLDPQKLTTAVGYQIYEYIGATLLIRDPNTNEFVPYLAESRKASDDGLSWDFKLREGVKFHDGTPLTAQAYVWTFERAMDPETKSPISWLGYVAGTEAVDEYTFRINLKAPYYPLLFALSGTNIQPLPKSAVEQLGDKFATQPVGCGPYKFKEWTTGIKVVVERNPDYNWGPAFMPQGPFNIQTIEFRFIRENATLLTALELGEVDIADVPVENVKRIQEWGRFNLEQGPRAGITNYVMLNISKPPFDDVLVRKALNLATNRQEVIDLVAPGGADVLYGPMTPGTIGYWPGVEEIGYGYDLEQAKALLEQAGYEMGSNGILEKDGTSLTIAVQASAGGTGVKVAEVLKEQWKQTGVESDIQLSDAGVMVKGWREGTYDIGINGWTTPEADLLYNIFHTKSIGGLNWHFLSDPESDKTLDETRQETDPAKRQEAVNQAQKRIVEQAYIIPIMAQMQFFAVSKRVVGYNFAQQPCRFFLGNAYIKAE